MIKDLFVSILGISLSTGLAAALFMLLTPLFRKRYTARWSCYIWIFIALRLLVPVSGSSITGFAQHIMSSFSARQQETVNSPVINTPRQRVMIEIPTQMATEITVQKEGRKTITLLDIAAYVWFAGCIVFLAFPVFSCINFRHQVSRKGTAVENGPVKTQLQKLTRELHIRRPVPAVEYDGTISPMITGIFRPVVVLPRKAYTEKELYFILKHELIHLKRNDVLVKFLYVAANALHWFNPLVYIMRKQAVVDMELSCDERVVSGTAYADRRDYTETLFSTIKETCTKKTYLSTEFYGGKRIMKKRFKNILARSGKKNGLLVLSAAMAVTLMAGTLVGCSEAKKPAASKGLVQAADTKKEAGDTPPSQKELTIHKEGEPEVKLTVNTIGVGYSIYFPKDEWTENTFKNFSAALPDDTWLTDGRDIWNADVNDRVQLRVTHYTDFSAAARLEEAFTQAGYVQENNELVKKEEDLVIKVRLYDSDDDTWSVCYCYPSDAEEGWGRELPVIADTFAVTACSEDSKAFQRTVKSFVAAYFKKDVEELKKYLASPSETAAGVYEGAGTVNSMTIKGYAENEELLDGNEKSVSVEFKEGSEDSFTYLTLSLIRQEDEWKVKSYGLEK